MNCPYNKLWCKLLSVYLAIAVVEVITDPDSYLSYSYGLEGFIGKATCKKADCTSWQQSFDKTISLQLCLAIRLLVSLVYVIDH